MLLEFCCFALKFPLFISARLAFIVLESWLTNMYPVCFLKMLKISWTYIPLSISSFMSSVTLISDSTRWYSSSRYSLMYDIWWRFIIILIFTNVRTLDPLILTRVRSTRSNVTAFSFMHKYLNVRNLISSFRTYRSIFRVIDLMLGS